jgi:hypothetical protein
MLRKYKRVVPENLWNRLARNLIYDAKQHEKTILDTDYETVRGMLLWGNLFDGWHMVRRSYGFLSDLISFSFDKAEADIDALHHIQGLDEAGITAILANNIKLNRDYSRAESFYEKPIRVFDRENGALIGVIAETMELFDGDFGKHDHTLEHVPHEWFEPLGSFTAAGRHLRCEFAEERRSDRVVRQGGVPRS